MFPSGNKGKISCQVLLPRCITAKAFYSPLVASGSYSRLASASSSPHLIRGRHSSTWRSTHGYPDQPTDITVGPKIMYKAFVLDTNRQTTAYQHWTDVGSHPIHIVDDEDWSESNLSAYRTTRETKLHSLHFKVVNRILPCNKFLKQIRIKSSDVCDLCGQEDNISHFLFECLTVRTFWKSLCRWFEGVECLALDTLSPKRYVFGVPRTFPKASVVNFILMNTKFFIYRQSLFHGGSLDLMHWLRELKLKLLVEKQISCSEGKAHRFGRWTKILQSLG